MRNQNRLVVCLKGAQSPFWPFSWPSIKTRPVGPHLILEASFSLFTPLLLFGGSYCFVVMGQTFFFSFLNFGSWHGSKYQIRNSVYGNFLRDSGSFQKSLLCTSLIPIFLFYFCLLLLLAPACRTFGVILHPVFTWPEEIRNPLPSGQIDMSSVCLLIRYHCQTFVPSCKEESFQELLVFTCHFKKDSSQEIW